jgi:hypothetical protein
VDYGDIEDADLQQHFAPDYNAVDPFGVAGEKASLLGDGGSPSSNYGGSPSSNYYLSTSGNGIIQSTRGSKKTLSRHKWKSKEVVKEMNHVRGN